MRIRVAIINSRSFGIYTNAAEELKKYGDVDRLELPRNIPGKELGKSTKGYHFIIASTTPNYTREFFEENDTVVMIIRHGIGYDNIDIDAAEKHGVIVARVPGWREREAVAEHTIALLLSALRSVPQADIAVREGRWGDRTRFLAGELRSMSIGVIGCGNIGLRVIEILSRGFGSRVLCYDPYVSQEAVADAGGMLVSSLEDLLRQSDIITIHAPLTKETYHMLDEKAFEKMKDGVIIVNTARGEIIETQALIKYLERGKVRAAALDVVEGEPIDKNHPLLKLRNVIITPHIAAYTIEALKGMDQAVVDAIKNYMEGKPIEGLVVMPKNPRRLKP